MREPPEKDPPKQGSAAREWSPTKRRSRRSTSAKPIAPSDSSGRSASASTAGTGRIYIGAIAVLALGLATQAVLGFRDSLAAHVPATRPLLGAVCRAFGCTIDPLRDAAALFIEASDLQADPAHRGLLLLTATIRNRADHAIAYPYLELKLTDSADQVVVVGRLHRPNTRAARPICATASRRTANTLSGYSSTPARLGRQDIGCICSIREPVE